MMLRIGSSAFTLIEVMAAVAVLSLGILLIYETFFVSIDSMDFCSDYLDLACWVDERVWQAQNLLTIFGPSCVMETEGAFAKGHKAIEWSLSPALIDETQGLYKIDFVLSWKQGKRKISLSRSAYAIYEEE